MKIITFIALLLSFTFTGWQQAQDTVDIDEATIALEKSENILGTYIEKLDSEFTVKDVRAQIICKDYQYEYTQNYIPSMLKLSSEYTKSELLRDMNTTLDYYRSIENIQC